MTLHQYSILVDKLLLELPLDIRVPYISIENSDTILASWDGHGGYMEVYVTPQGFKWLGVGDGCCSRPMIEEQAPQQHIDKDCVSFLVKLLER